FGPPAGSASGSWAGLWVKPKKPIRRRVLIENPSARYSRGALEAQTKAVGYQWCGLWASVLQGVSCPAWNDRALTGPLPFRRPRYQPGQQTAQVVQANRLSLRPVQGLLRNAIAQHLRDYQTRPRCGA